MLESVIGGGLDLKRRLVKGRSQYLIADSSGCYLEAWASVAAVVGQDCLTGGGWLDSRARFAEMAESMATWLGRGKYVRGILDRASPQL